MFYPSNSESSDPPVIFIKVSFFKLFAKENDMRTKTTSKGNDTKREAVFGARKVINVPEGFKKKIFMLLVPPGTSEGSKMRLSGLGRKLDGGKSGDLYLKVNIED